MGITVDRVLIALLSCDAIVIETAEKHAERNITPNQSQHGVNNFPQAFLDGRAYYLEKIPESWTSSAFQ